MLQAFAARALGIGRQMAARMGKTAVIATLAQRVKSGGAAQSGYAPRRAQRGSERERGVIGEWHVTTVKVCDNMSFVCPSRWLFLNFGKLAFSVVLQARANRLAKSGRTASRAGHAPTSVRSLLKTSRLPDKANHM